MKKGRLAPIVKIPPQVESIEKFLTQSGTFKAGDLLVNKYGIRIAPKGEEEKVDVIKASDDQLYLTDMDVIKVIGKGSGGIVQLVRHKWTGQFFALKVIQMKIDTAEREQIARELKINHCAQCPYVVICYQSFYDNGVISIVLEYMDGGSLDDFLKKVKTIPEPYLAAICRQVLEGLMYLHHEKHIIHRDLKPSNILINHRGEVKITDFGVSVILASTSGLRDTTIGTYNYMSPERISSQSYGYISDIWSLGLVMLECATGRFPYSEKPIWDNFYEFLVRVVEQPAPEAPPELFSPEFCSFISACVQKDPKDRQSAPALLRHPFLSKYENMNVDLAAYFTCTGSPLATFY